MNNTITRLAVSAVADSLHILYAHMLPLFRRAHIYTRANDCERKGNLGIKKNLVSLRARWSGRHLRLSALPNEGLASLPFSHTCTRGYQLTWLLSKWDFPSRNRAYACSSRHKHAPKICPARVSTGTHSSLINIPIVGTITVFAIQSPPIRVCLSVRPLQRSPLRCNQHFVKIAPWAAHIHRVEENTPLENFTIRSRDREFIVTVFLPLFFFLFNLPLITRHTSS